MSEIDTKTKLLKTAIKLFALRGVDGVSVKEICDEADVNVSSVSYHFNGKDGLLKACLEEFGEDRLKVAEKILQPFQSQEEFLIRIGLFLEDVLEFHFRERELVRLLHRELELHSPVAITVFKDTFAKSFQRVVDYVQLGKKKGFVRKTVDAPIFISMLFSSISKTACIKDVIGLMPGFPESPKELRERMYAQLMTVVREVLFVDQKDTQLSRPL